MDSDVISHLNKNVDLLLKVNNIKTRSAGHGVWLNLLLPVAVISSVLKYNCSEIYIIASCISCGILVNSLLTIIFLSSNLFFKTLYYFVTSSITVVTLIIFSKQGLLLNLTFGLFSSFGYQLILLNLMKVCPQSFTFGEASIVTQSFILFISSAIANFGYTSYRNCMQIATILLQVGLLGVILICCGCYYCPQLRNPNQFYSLVASVIFLIIIPLLHCVLHFSPVLWIIDLFIEDAVVIYLTIFWIVCSTIAVFAVIFQVSGQQKASSIVRKIFHILAVAVFVPGLIYRPCFLYLASGIAFALFIALEVIRVLKMPPLGVGLNDAFNVFADQKDEGPLALTPIYLLVGCFGPLWLHPLPDFDNSGLTTPPPHIFLPLLAGLLSVGIGDTAASVCGTWFGQNFWPGSKKSKEGSAACFISQLFLVIALIHHGYVPRANLLRPTVSVAVISLVEAKTEQVDNLILPLLLYIMLL